MDFIRNFPMFSVVLSLFSGVLCTLLSGRAARRWTLLWEGLLMAMAAAVLWYTRETGSAFTYTMGEFPAPWGNELRGGVLEGTMALSFLIVLFCAVLGGWDFVRVDVDPSKWNLFFSLVNLLTAALMALVYTNDIFTGYVFLEILTLSGCGVLMIREIGRTTLAAVRYMLMNLLGSGLFLLGVVLLYNLTGQLLMVPMRKAVGELAVSGARTPLVFSLTILTLGLGMKCGLFPFYTWMPDTYGSATPTAAAILSALVSKAYLFLLFKIYSRCIGLELFETLPLRWLLLSLGILGMLFGSLAALRSGSLNRMVSYSSAAQIGYIFMGLGMGGLGYAAAMFHILVHAVTKSLLFLTTPRLARVSGDSLLFENLQGSGRRAKDAGTFFTCAAFSMVGIPLFAGFSSKLLFAVAAAESGGRGVLFSVMLALAVSSVLNAMYFVRTVIRIFTLGRGGADLDAPAIYAREHAAAPDELPAEPASPLLYGLSAAVLTACNLFLGLFSPAAVALIQQGLSMFA